MIAGLHRRLHELQAFGEHSQLIAPLHAQGHVVGAGAHLIDGLGQVLQRPRDIAGQPEGGQRRSDQADGGDQEQHLGQTLERRARIRQGARQDGDDFGIAPAGHFDAPGDDVGLTSQRRPARCSRQSLQRPPEFTDRVTARPVMSASSRAALSSSSKPMAIHATGSGLRTDTVTSW